MSPHTIKESKVYPREENAHISSNMWQTKSTRTNLQNPRNQMKENLPSIATFDPTKPPPLLVKKENILRPTRSVASSNSLKEVQDHSMRSEVDKEIGMGVEYTLYIDENRRKREVAMSPSYLLTGPLIQ